MEGIAQLVRAERLMEMGMSVDEALPRLILGRVRQLTPGFGAPDPPRPDPSGPGGQLGCGRRGHDSGNSGNLPPARPCAARDDFHSSLAELVARAACLATLGGLDMTL